MIFIPFHWQDSCPKASTARQGSKPTSSSASGWTDGCSPALASVGVYFVLFCFFSGIFMQNPSREKCRGWESLGPLTLVSTSVLLWTPRFPPPPTPISGTWWDFPENNCTRAREGRQASWRANLLPVRPLEESYFLFQSVNNGLRAQKEAWQGTCQHFQHSQSLNIQTPWRWRIFDFSLQIFFLRMSTNVVFAEWRVWPCLAL